MSFDADDEILQDFLVEAGEILETLNEELVELEQHPEDADMINSVFRGFHTIKGGAGFLALTPLIELCHRSEDVFGLIRTGELHLTSHMMDVFLSVLDSLNVMFDDLRSGQEPSAADPEQLHALDLILKGESDSSPEDNASPTASSETENTATDSAQEKDLTDAEFDNLLDALDDNETKASSASDDGFIDLSEESATAEVVSDEISDSEFDDLLDQLHGKGQFNSGISKQFEEKSETPAPSNPAPSNTESTTSVNNAVISDDEFESYLDELHGKGKFGAVEAQTTVDNDSKEEQPAVSNNKTEPEPEQKVQKAENTNPAVVKQEPVTASKPELIKKEAVKKKPVKKDPPAVQSETTVRVDTKRLDDIMNMVGELVLVRNRLVTLDSAMANEEMSKAVSSLDMVTSDLQTSVMKTRMQPVKKVFGRFPRVVRDISRTMKKEVKLVLVGEDTDLDKNLVEALADPLVHLVRNSVDHGIEIPDVRLANDKPRQGTVTLSAAQEGDHILLTIEDDGAGMDAEFLRKKVVDKGLMEEDAASRLTEKECYNLIFMPGFSTKDVISDVSGRGVGMDVVRTRISQLNGAVEIESEIGKGTLISIMVPLTLAIMPTLMVKLKAQSFALPLVSVNEIFHLDLTKTNTIDGQLVIMVREKPLPLIYLTRWLVKGADYEELPEQGHVVVVHVGTKKVGFVVNELIGQEEVVIKPLGSMLQGTEGLAGATITGDGQIALIVDIPSLMSSHAGTNTI
ncbi:MAG: chemotaxis protein CheA [Pseudomonadota bacterium]